jgi:hypothetical protein
VKKQILDTSMMFAVISMGAFYCEMVNSRFFLQEYYSKIDLVDIFAHGMPFLCLMSAQKLLPKLYAIFILSFTTIFLCPYAFQSFKNECSLLKRVLATNLFEKFVFNLFVGFPLAVLFYVVIHKNQVLSHDAGWSFFWCFLRDLRASQLPIYYLLAEAVIWASNLISSVNIKRLKAHFSWTNGATSMN